tara:strand:- start:314 stop:643 length:330 start_codon:yes stop_codon:yes gene_type:complete
MQGTRKDLERSAIMMSNIKNPMLLVEEDVLDNRLRKKAAKHKKKRNELNSNPETSGGNKAYKQHEKYKKATKKAQEKFGKTRLEINTALKIKNSANLIDTGLDGTKRGS